MGEGTTSSYRFDKNRKLTPQEQITYWEDRAMQYKSAHDRLLKENESLALRIAKAGRLLTKYALKLEQAQRMLAICGDLFSFKVPTITEPELENEEQTDQ